MENNTIIKAATYNVYRLYVENTGGDSFNAVLDMVSCYFESCTLTRGQGMWNKEIEDVWIVEIHMPIAQDVDAEIAALALDLKNAFEQDAVLVTLQRAEDYLV